MFGINFASAKDAENEVLWMKQLLEMNPGPVLRVTKDGTVLYANEASVPLLKLWDTCKGGELPPKITCFARKVISEKRPRTLEIKEREDEYSLTFSPQGEEYVHIYGLDLTSRKQDEEKLRMQENQEKALSRLGEFSLSSAGLKPLMDRASKMVASALKVESCKILKLPEGGGVFPGNVPAGLEKGQSLDAEGSDLYSQSHSQSSVSSHSQSSASSHSQSSVSSHSQSSVSSHSQSSASSRLQSLSQPFSQSSLQSHAFHDFAGGISIPAISSESPCVVLTLHSLKPREFTSEEVYFLRAVLDMVAKIIKFREIDRKLQDRIRFLENLLDTLPVPGSSMDRPGTWQECSELFAGKVVDFSKEDLAGHPMAELEEVIHKELAAIYKKKEGDISGEAAGLVGAMVDISEFRENEEALRIALEVQKVLWTVINNSPAVVFLWRNEENWPSEFVSENVSQFGYLVEDFTSGKVLYGDIVHREDIERVREGLDRCIDDGYDSFKMEYRIFTKEGLLRWVDERTFIQRDAEGKAVLFQGVVIDITERKVAEEALAIAEQIRKKEINHRIKNNLQIVSSLLDLQAEKFNDEKVIEAFRESENRVVSMSLIHEELYESGDLDSLDFASYIRKLIADLLHSYNVGSSDIRLHLDVCSVFLGVDTVIALGIIINELFTNSLKYAFPAGNGGEIHIALIREAIDDFEVIDDLRVIDENQTSGKAPIPENSRNTLGIYEHFTLVFADNGKGFPGDVDFRNPDTLGLQLVNALVDQIGGGFDLEKGKGTKFTIKFKDEIRGSNRRLMSEAESRGKS